MAKTLNIAVIGAGGFAHFATTAFVKIPGVKLVGVFDEIAAHALRLKELDDSVKVYDSSESLCAAAAIDLVYIATPPFLHYEQSKMALLAGKHVICEKPLALTVEQADELVGLARRQDR